MLVCILYDDNFLGLTKKKLDSMRGDIYFNLGLGYEKLNDSENALKSFNKSLAEYK